MRWLIAVVAIALTAAFPPTRRVGVWTSEATGEPIPTHYAQDFDRFLFGFIPSHGWIGNVGLDAACEPGAKISIQDRGAYQCSTYTWAIDWPFFGAQIVVAFGLFLVSFRRTHIAAD